jgi:hypothetical protein
VNRSAVLSACVPRRAERSERRAERSERRAERSRLAATHGVRLQHTALELVSPSPLDEDGRTPLRELGSESLLLSPLLTAQSARAEARLQPNEHPERRVPVGRGERRRGEHLHAAEGCSRKSLPSAAYLMRGAITDHQVPSDAIS